MNLPALQDKMQFNAVTNGVASTIPLKFSYHEDGHVHFKPTKTVSNIPLSYKTAEIKTIPITKFKGEHIFTIQLEGLNAFDDLDEKSKNKNYLACGEITQGKEFIKLIGYLGSSENEILGKIGSVNPFIKVKIERPHIGRPIFLGIYLGEGNSIQTDIKIPYLLSMVGFKKEANDTLKSLYLWAK